MAPKRKTRKNARKHERLKRDKVGDLFAVVRSDTGEGSLRISFRRNWYSPPYSDDGEVDFEAAAAELSEQLSGGTIILRNYLENGELSFSTEIHVESTEELERVLHTIRIVYTEGLKQDNATRTAALAQCQARLADATPDDSQQRDRRRTSERRKGDRRDSHRFGRAVFRRRERRMDEDRRAGLERRARNA